MSDQSDSELGRSKSSVSPREHLIHLLTIGWDPKSPLIRKYVALNDLGRVLSDWVEKTKPITK
ncbi:hypothetical protein KF707_14460 [Candidatus Obscuribacterales bacterium]|nr:hypothetical protein [Candidatus Obscuribacterales bacterium]MBX3151596.1 hypothetical protein [Candidatus Obscuribacterales bacterium]